MYIEKVQQVAEIMRSLSVGGDINDVSAGEAQTIELLKETTKVKLPVIGVFNAGKTTLVNSLIKDDGKLPVRIVPETAIPCEIYPLENGQTPHAEIWRGDTCLYSGGIAGYGQVSVEPGDFGKVYTSSPVVKAWSDKGIILVDMPGFDSGIEEHNRAIGRYMNQGTVFAFLLNCTHGSLRANEISLMKEVCQYGIKIGLFLTWTDQQTSDKNEEVKAFIEYQSKSFLPDGTYVGMLSAEKGDNGDFVRFVSGLDVEKIISEKSKPIAESFIRKQMANLQGALAIARSGGDQSDIDRQIDELTQRISEMERMLQSRLSDADTPEKSAQDILDAVRAAIKENAGMLADAILETRGEGTLVTVNETLVSIIRPALAVAFKEEQEQFVETLKTELSAITKKLLENVDIPKDVLDQIIDNNERAIVGWVEVLADTLMNSENPALRVVGQILSFVVQYIPDMIRGLFGGNDRARAKLAEKIQGSYADAIVSGLRQPVTEQVRAFQGRILQSTCSQYEAGIRRMKETLDALYRSKENGQFEIAAVIEKYQIAFDKIEAICNSL